MAQVSGALTIRVGRRFRLRPGACLGYICLILLLLFTSLPLVYLVSTAFKPLDELFVYPPQFFVRHPTVKNFGDLLTSVSSSVVPFTRYIFNSVWVSVTVVVGTVVLSSMGAFALAKYRLPGANFIFSLVIAVLMFSPHVTAIPTYMIVNSLHLIDTYWALVLPKVAVAYNFFLMKQFIEQFPNDILESGRIDGAGEWYLFWRMVMPNVKPAWATLAVLSFVSNWNDYMTPLIYTSSQSMKTLPLALQTISGGAGTIARTGAMAAATFLTTVPTIVVFVIMKNKVMETMTYSGIKG